LVCDSNQLEPRLKGDLAGVDGGVDGAPEEGEGLDGRKYGLGLVRGRWMVMKGRERLQQSSLVWDWRKWLRVGPRWASMEVESGGRWAFLCFDLFLSTHTQ
jgi:hypothetical protein